MNFYTDEKKNSSSIRKLILYSSYFNSLISSKGKRYFCISFVSEKFYKQKKKKNQHQLTYLISSSTQTAVHSKPTIHNGCGKYIIQINQMCPHLFLLHRTSISLIFFGYFDSNLVLFNLKIIQLSDCTLSIS